MDHQDWESVTFTSRRGAPKSGVAAQADRAGRVKAIIKSAAAAGEHAAAVERRAEECVLKTKKVCAESKQAVVQARLARKLTQDQADAECMLPKHTIKGIEAGTLMPTSDVIRKVSRGLHVDIKLE